MSSLAGAVWCRLQVSDGPNGCLDVIGTHMQAGNRRWEQSARRHQAKQLAAFIRRHTDVNDGPPVVLAGDLNMGPVLDSTFRRYSGHYGSVHDARCRHESYAILRGGCGLDDVACVEGDNEDIMRYLSSGLGAIGVRYLDFAGLSDGPALVATAAWDSLLRGDRKLAADTFLLPV